MSTDEQQTQTQQQDEIPTEPTLANVFEESPQEETTPTEQTTKTKSLRQLCKEKLVAHKPKNKQEARGLWRTVTQEVIGEVGGTCDRANVYKAANDLEEEGFFLNANSPVEGGTFTAKIPEVPITPLQRETPQAQQPTEQIEQTYPDTTPSAFPPGSGALPIAPQPQQVEYNFIEPNQKDVDALKVLSQMVCKKAADALDEPKLLMDDKEGAAFSRAFIIITADETGRIDPRIIAGLTVAVSVGSRALMAAPKAKEKLDAMMKKQKGVN